MSLKVVLAEAILKSSAGCTGLAWSEHIDFYGLQFKPAVEHLQKTLVDGKTTGVVNLILADGTQPEPKGFNGGSVINVPWGINIDGNDDVWVAGFWARNAVLMAGHDTSGQPEDTKPGQDVRAYKRPPK